MFSRNHGTCCLWALSCTYKHCPREVLLIIYKGVSLVGKPYLSCFFHLMFLTPNEKLGTWFDEFKWVWKLQCCEGQCYCRSMDFASLSCRISYGSTFFVNYIHEICPYALLILVSFLNKCRTCSHRISYTFSLQTLLLSKLTFQHIWSFGGINLETPKKIYQ